MQIAILCRFTAGMPHTHNLRRAQPDYLRLHILPLALTATRYFVSPRNYRIDLASLAGDNTVSGVLGGCERARAPIKCKSQSRDSSGRQSAGGDDVL